MWIFLVRGCFVISGNIIKKNLFLWYYYIFFSIWYTFVAWLILCGAFVLFNFKMLDTFYLVNYCSETCNPKLWEKYLSASSDFLLAAPSFHQKDIRNWPLATALTSFFGHVWLILCCGGTSIIQLFIEYLINSNSYTFTVFFLRMFSFLN